MVVARERGYSELLYNRYRVSVWEDKRGLGVDDGNGFTRM
jgi:hypothetical protein